jgi:hypothetical protein
MLMDIEPDHGQRPRGPLWSALQAKQLRLRVDRCRRQLAKGHYTDSAALIDPIGDVVRAGPLWPALQTKQLYILGKPLQATAGRKGITQRVQTWLNLG